MNLALKKKKTPCNNNKQEEGEEEDREKRRGRRRREGLGRQKRKSIYQHISSFAQSHDLTVSFGPKHRSPQRGLEK